MSSDGIWENFKKAVEDKVFDDHLVKGSFYFLIGEDSKRTESALDLIKENRKSLWRSVVLEMSGQVVA
jgi:hypothetical protein